MTVRRWIAGAALTLLLGVGPLGVSAQAAPSGDTLRTDTRCLLALSAAVGTTKDEGEKYYYALGGMYFLGRIQAVSPDLDLAKAMRAEADTFSPAVAKTVTAECIDTLKARAREMIAVGEQLQDLSK